MDVVMICEQTDAWMFTWTLGLSSGFGSLATRL